VHPARAHWAMALVAQRVDVGHVQKPRILRSVRRVAAQASFTLDRRMLIHERSTRLCVALRANRILVRGRFQIVVAERPVHVMAVAATHQALIHLVVKRHCKRWLDTRMALVAEVRLRRHQQRRIRNRLVDAMAAQATHPRLGMRRA